MDGQNSFEQQFTQNLQASMATAPEKPNKSKFAVITIILAVIIVLESIVLIAVIVSSNMQQSSSEDFAEEYEEIEEDEGEEDLTETDPTEYEIDAYYYKDNSLSAFSLICIQDSSLASFNFSPDNSVREYDSSSSLIASGTYSISNEHLIKITYSNDNKERVLYYDGTNIADGLTIYYCNENYERATE